jgi:hypothetical protein
MRVFISIAALAGVIFVAEQIGTAWIAAPWAIVVLPIWATWFVARQVRKSRQAPSGPAPTEVMHRSVVKASVAGLVVVAAIAYGVALADGKQTSGAAGSEARERSHPNDVAGNT